MARLACNTCYAVAGIWHSYQVQNRTRDAPGWWFIMDEPPQLWLLVKRGVDINFVQFSDSKINALQDSINMDPKLSELKEIILPGWPEKQYQMLGVINQVYLLWNLSVIRFSFKIIDWKRKKGVWKVDWRNSSKHTSRESTNIESWNYFKRKFQYKSFWKQNEWKMHQKHLQKVHAFGNTCCELLFETNVS